LVSDQLGDDLVSRIAEVVQHVLSRLAAEAIEAARDAEVGVIVSIGGGSATGLAKAIARNTELPSLPCPPRTPAAR
jgi:alcohol dehydrogenase class IV